MKAYERSPKSSREPSIQFRPCRWGARVESTNHNSQFPTVLTIAIFRIYPYHPNLIGLCRNWRQRLFILLVNKSPTDSSSRWKSAAALTRNSNLRSLGFGHGRHACPVAFSQLLRWSWCLLMSLWPTMRSCLATCVLLIGQSRSRSYGRGPFQEAPRGIESSTTSYQIDFLWWHASSRPTVVCDYFGNPNRYVLVGKSRQARHWKCEAHKIFQAKGQGSQRLCIREQKEDRRGADSRT